MIGGSRQAKAVFCEAIEQHPPERWAEFLDQACADDKDLRRQVERLLAAHRELGSFHESMPETQGFAVETKSILESPGTQIGPYRLVEQLGEGGMGVVYLAEQTAPVRRQVALKVIKPGLDTRQVVSRFEAERQALAMMDHPNIAKVLDAGATPAGRPFFVMELVRGLPITEFCDAERMTIPDRLRLFLQVCDAIQHAHQKAIIHRDLKPTNVLVAQQDTHPVVKVIDFGVAKALGQQLTDHSLQTGFTQLVGTPLYMSPEQAGPNRMDVDTRSDVYSLGVLLYELLTGTTPFATDAAKAADYEDLRRIVRELDPPRPSERISSLVADRVSALALRRQLDSRRFRRQVQGELDWIIMKALEKDRNRRYESASTLAADMERYLSNKAVHACPPTTFYQLKKLVGRHKTALAVVAVIGVTLLAGIFGTASQAIRARAESRHAMEAERLSEERYRLAKDAVVTYLVRVTEEKRLQHPGLSDLRKQLVESALPFFERLRDQSADAAKSRTNRGDALGQLGIIRQELGELEQADRDLQGAIQIFAQMAASEPHEANHRRALAKWQVHSAALLRLRGEPKEKTGPIEEQALALRQSLVAEQPDVADLLHDLACSLNNVSLHTGGTKSRRYLEQAIDIWEKLVQRFPDNRIYREFLSRGYHNLAYKAGWDRFDEPLKFQQRALDLTSQLAREQPDSETAQIAWAKSHFHFANSLENELKRPEEARTHREQAVQILGEYVAKHGPSPDVTHSLASEQQALALTLTSLKQWPAACEASLAAVKSFEELVHDFPDSFEYQVSLAGQEANQGSLLRRSGMAPPDEIRTWLTRSRDRLQRTRERVGAHGKADEFMRVVTEHLTQLGGDHCNRGHELRGAGKPKEALEWYRLAIEVLEPVARDQSDQVIARRFLRNTYQGRSSTYVDLDQLSEALEDIDRAVALDDESRRPLRTQRIAILSQVDARQAVAEINNLLDAESPTAQQLYEAASLCLLAAIGAADQVDLENSCARTVALLKRASEAGYFADASQLAQLDEFALLNGREDFQALRAELEGAR